MTTIAYRNGELAGDSLITAGDTKMPERARKVFRFRDGRLFGASGDSVGGVRLMMATKRCEPTPNIKGVNALMIFPDTKKIAFYEGGQWTDVDAEFAAIGAGGPYALGALVVGASAREAVKAGCKLSTHSGGRIYVVRLR